MEINQGKVYHSKLKNAGHTYGTVYYGKIEFTMVNLVTMVTPFHVIQIPHQQNLDLLVGFQIPWAKFQIPQENISQIMDFTRKNFRTGVGKIKRVRSFRYKLFDTKSFLYKLQSRFDTSRFDTSRFDTNSKLHKNFDQVRGTIYI